MEKRGSYGPDAPTGPGEDGRRQAVRHLPGHRLPLAHPSRRQAAGDAGHQILGGARLEPGGAVDHLAPVGGDQFVEGRDIPRPSGACIVGGEGRDPGRIESVDHPGHPTLGARPSRCRISPNSPLTTPEASRTARGPSDQALWGDLVTGDPLKGSRRARIGWSWVPRANTNVTAMSGIETGRPWIWH